VAAAAIATTRAHLRDRRRQELRFAESFIFILMVESPYLLLKNLLALSS
jgi:hypothetical protein